MTNLITNVFNAARNEGKQQTVSVDAIKAAIVSWSDAVNVTNVANAYKAGRLCATLGLKDQAAAVKVFALKPHKDGGNDTVRTLAQHQACRAAISAWSNIRMRAGAPNARDAGKTRTARATTTTTEPPKVAPVGFEPAITKATSVQDVHAYALRMAQNVLKYVNAAGPVFVVGATGDTLRAFISDVRKAVKADQAERNAKTPIAA